MRIEWVLALMLVIVASARAERPPELWLYYPTNFQVDENVPKLEAIWRRAAKAGYTHVLLADSKFAKLGDLGGMERRYFANVEKTKKLAEELKLTIVPTVFHVGYSSALLWHDPNLAEGLPVKDSKFVVKNGEARLVADPAVEFPQRPGFVDETVKMEEGVASMGPIEKGNGRFNYKIAVAPYRCYHISAKVRTEEFVGEPHINVLGGPRSLQHTNLKIARTQDWKEQHVVFDSMENTQVGIYFGVWSGCKGKIQFKDWKIEEVGLLNVLRREGTPCVVKGYVEGKDYDPIRDPRMGNVQWKGEYEVWHEPPVIKTKGIAAGTELRVSWYYPAIIYSGQVSCCPSEPKTMELFADEAKRVKEAWGAKGYMMSFDEIRSLDTDESCVKRNLDAGEILADTVGKCMKLLEESTVYTWNDMFDPYHNARKDYYLVRGDLKGSWEGLDKSVVVINWNFGKRDESLKFFADRGHWQVIAGYYDHRPEQVKDWLASAAKMKGVVGVMYTTWKNDYSQVEKFAELCRE